MLSRTCRGLESYWAYYARFKVRSNITLLAGIPHKEQCFIQIKLYSPSIWLSWCTISVCGIHWKSDNRHDANLVVSGSNVGCCNSTKIHTLPSHKTYFKMLSTHLCHRVQWLTVISRNDATSRETSWAILNNLIRYTKDKKKKHAQLCSDHNSCWWSSTIMCKEVCRIIYETATKMVGGKVLSQRAEYSRKN